MRAFTWLCCLLLLLGLFLGCFWVFDELTTPGECWVVAIAVCALEIVGCAVFEAVVTGAFRADLYLVSTLAR
jgi:hypothetical protein